MSKDLSEPAGLIRLEMSVVKAADRDARNHF